MQGTRVLKSGKWEKYMWEEIMQQYIIFHKKGLNEEVKKSSSSRHARYRKQETWTSLFPCLFGERKRDSSSLVYVLHKSCK